MMEDLEHMVDQDISALERALLQEGRSYRASDDLRGHTLAALGLTTSVGFAGAIAWLATKSWTTKLVLALSTVTLLAALPISYAVLVGRVPREAPTPSDVVVVAPPELALPTTPATAPADPIQALSFDRLATSPSAPARASAKTSTALRAELAALDAVRATLAVHDPAGALSFLSAYFRTFPAGRLRFEAEVLRIDALAQAGQASVAKRYAQDFLKRHPNSVLTARVRPYAEP
jgi:hypothetical protein